VRGNGAAPDKRNSNFTTEVTEDTEESVRLSEINVRSGQVVDAAMKVHSALGPGLLESAYEACLAYELRKCGMRVETQVPLPVIYDGQRIDVGYRLDLLVEDVVVVELKAMPKLHPVVEAQLLSYLKLSNYPIGLLINFHVPRLKDGIKRFANL
jgi:GxxExxY protein